TEDFPEQHEAAAPVLRVERVHLAERLRGLLRRLPRSSERQQGPALLERELRVVALRQIPAEELPALLDLLQRLLWVPGLDLRVGKQLVRERDVRAVLGPLEDPDRPSCVAA